MNRLDYERTLDALKGELRGCDEALERIIERELRLQRQKEERYKRRTELAVAVRELEQLRCATDDECWSWKQESKVAFPVVDQWRLNLIGHQFVMDLISQQNEFLMHLYGSKSLPTGINDWEYLEHRYGQNPLRFPCKDANEASRLMEDWKDRLLKDHESIIRWQRDTANNLH